MNAREVAADIRDGAVASARYEPSTIGQMIADAASRNGHRAALLAPGREALSHGALEALIRRLTPQLRAARIGAQTRVAVVLPKSLDNALACLALASACCCVPVNPDSTPAELESLLRAAGCDWVLARRDSEAWRCAERLGLGCFAIDGAEPADIGFLGLPPAQGAAQAPSEPGGQDIALLLQTSGSSGVPKLVPLTHRQLLRSAGNVARCLALGPADRCLNMMPLFHVGALVDLLLAPLLAGGSVIVTEQISARQFFATLRELAPTWYQGVPTMLREVVSIAQLEPHRLRGGRLRLIRAVSSAISERLQREIEQVFACPVVAIYGMTETAGVITSNPLPPGLAKPGSVGLSAGPEVAIRRADGTSVPVGEDGEICVRGESVIAAYENVAPTTQTHWPGGWLRTGDVGHFDEDGYLFISGRLKDIINRGGEKIAPLEIDHCALEMSQVEQAAAFAVPHPTLGEEVALAVVRRQGSGLTEREIREHLKRRLAAHKLPRQIQLLDALPLGRTGKIQRRALTERYGTAPEPAGFKAPGTPDAKVLAGLWQRALAVEQVGMDDNFFDLGGDSLTAANFVLDLEALIGTRLPPGMLFEHPTLSAFLAQLERLPKSVELAAFLDSAVPESDLPPAVFGRLRGLLGGWGGQRAHPHSLFLGHRLDAERKPLFWVVNDHGEMRETLRHLDPQRPVYVTRSLYRLEGDTVDYRRALGEHLAHELVRLQPEGSILLGGFCSGGRVALQIAEALTAQGRQVALLCLMDTKVHHPYHGDVLLLQTRHSFTEPRGQFVEPQRGWERYYQGRVRVETLAARHSEVLDRRHSRAFGKTLGAALRNHEAGVTRWARAAARLPIIEDSAYRAEIRCAPPRRVAPGASLKLSVLVRNASEQPWQRTAGSGVYLGAALRKPRRDPQADLGGGRRLCDWVELDEDLAPGGCVELQLTLRAPWRPRRYVLQIDMIDEGIAWFGDRGSEPFEAVLDVVLGASLIERFENPKP